MVMSGMIKTPSSYPEFQQHTNFLFWKNFIAVRSISSHAILDSGAEFSPNQEYRPLTHLLLIMATKTFF